MTTTSWSFGRHRRGGWHWLLPLAVIIAIMGAIVGVTGGTVSAHAGLKSADPADKATLPQSPAQVLLIFSDETSATRSEGIVKDGSGSIVSTGWKVDLNERSRMTIALRPGLPDGIYTVNWRTLDEADNESFSGTLAFTVRAGAPAPPTMSAPGGAVIGAPAVATVGRADASPARPISAATVTPRGASDQESMSGMPRTPWYIVALLMFGTSGALLAIALLAFRVKQRRIMARDR